MIVPSWVYWVAIAALAAVVLGQQARVANAKRETAEVSAAIDKEKRERAEDLAAYRQEKADLAAAHAANQQGLTDDFQKKLLLAQDERNRRDVLIGRLRAQISTFATVDRQPGDSDAVVIERAGDKLKTLGGLLASGAELVGEGAGIVQQRDAEVAALLEQVRVDRQACSAQRTSPSPTRLAAP